MKRLGALLASLLLAGSLTACGGTAAQEMQSIQVFAMDTVMGLRACGGETEAADERERMIATLMFRISNVDLDQLDAFIHSPRLGETIRQGRESGVLKGGIQAFTPIPGTRDVSLNVTRAKFDHEDLADATRGMVELRSQIEPIFRFVQREVPGLAFG